MRPLSAIDLHHATAVALHALRWLAAATVTLDALDLQALASATASTLETCGPGRRRRLFDVGHSAPGRAAFAAAAARFRLGLVASMSAAGFCRGGAVIASAATPAARNSLVMRNLL